MRGKRETGDTLLAKYISEVSELSKGGYFLKGTI